MIRILILLLFPIFLSAQITNAYGVIEIGGFPTSSATGPKFAYNPADSSFYRWSHGSVWVKIIEPSITSDTIFITDQIGTSYVVSGDTINLTPYLLESDTSAMLVKYIERGDTTGMMSAYIRSAGWGLLKTSHTLTVDSSKVASRYYVSTSPTTIANNYIATSNGSNLVARNLFDNNTYVGILNSKPFQLGQWTTAGRPSGVNGYKGRNITTGFDEGYFTSQWENYITSIGAANGQVSIFSSAGKIYGTNNLFWDNANARLKIGNTSGTATLFVQNSAETESLVKVVAANQNPYLVRMYNNTFSTTTPVFEYFAFNTGEFRQGTVNGDLTFTTNGYSNRRMIIKNNTGYVGIGSLSGPSRLLHVEGEVRIADLTTDTPTRIVGADADGDLGALALSGLTISSGTLTATPNWLKTQMEAGNNVNINAGSTFLKVKQGTNNFWKIKNGDQFYQNASDGLSIIPWNDTMTTRPTGSLVIGGYHLSGKASNFSTIVTQYGTAHSTNNTDLSYFNSLFGYDSHSDSTTWNSLFGAKNLSSKTSRVTIIGSGDTINASFSGAFGYSHTINQPYRFQYGAGVDQFVRHFFYGKLMVGTDSTFYFNPDTDLLRLSAYGTNATTAATLSKTESGYVASFADDGTVTSFKLARDTFIEDVTLFSVGTLLNSCQELTIVSSMTVLAPSNQEIRIPDAADYLRGKKIIVYSKKKDGGSFVPFISVVGGVSRLFYTTDPGIAGTDPIDHASLYIDNSTWSDHGTTFEFTCLKIDNTPSYRWVLKQR